MTIRKDLYEKHVHIVPEGRVVFSEGDKAEGMYIIIDGEIEISKRTGLDTSKTLIVLKNGDMFGEMALIEQKPRSATAIAMRQTRLLSLDNGLFFSMISKNPDFAVKVVKILSERIRRSNMVIQQLSTMNRENLILQGMHDYALNSGQDSTRGRKIGKNQFIFWATSHIGLNDKDVQEGIRILIQRSLVTAVPQSDDLILSNKTTA